MKTENDQQLRRILKDILVKGMAHAPFESAIRDFPGEFVNKSAKEGLNTFWQLLEHIRIGFIDIIEYIDDPEYQLPVFPDGYWPKVTESATVEQWNTSVEHIKNMYSIFHSILDDPQKDLFKELELRPGSNHFILREILIILDHNAFHVGQIVLMRKIFGIWHN